VKKETYRIRIANYEIISPTSLYFLLHLYK